MSHSSFPAPGQVPGMSAVGDNLARIMLRGHWSPDKLGRELGHVDGGYVRSVLAGRKYPGDDMLTRMARILGIRKDDLTRLPGSKPPA